MDCWDCGPEELIRRIENLGRGSMIFMSQCGFILSDGSRRIAIDTVLSDLPSKETGKSRRLVSPPFGPGRMPHLDAVLVTHAHADHLDRPMIEEALRHDPSLAVLAPVSSGVCNMPSLSDYREVPIGDFRIVPIPVPHMEYSESSPGHSDFYGYIIRIGDISVFHAGDTVPSRRLLSDIAGYGKMDAVILPVNGRDREREARGLVGNMDGAEAVEFASAVSAGVLIPSHFDMIAGNTGDIPSFLACADGRIDTIVPHPGRIISLAAG